MLTTPITTPHFHSSVQALLSNYHSANDGGASPGSVPLPLIPPLKPADTTLVPHDAIGQYLATTSTWIDLASPDPVIANISRQVFNLEVAYAAFCGVQNAIIQGPLLRGPSYTSSGLAQYTRAIQEALSIGPYLQLHILLPIHPNGSNPTRDPSHLSHFARPSHGQLVPGNEIEGASVDPWRAWEAWDSIRTFCKYNGKLTVALRLSRRLPSPAIQDRWFSEPLRLLVIPGSSFTLKTGSEQPLLSPGHKALLSKYMRLRSMPWVLLSDAEPMPVADVAPLPGVVSNDPSGPPFPTPAEASKIHKHALNVREDPTPHLSYLRWLQNHQPPRSMIERFGSGYQDFLQAPLQPLADNLESITYEVFEKDPIKYDWYERAIMHALIDWSAQGKSVSSTTGAVVIAVAGSGRGPIVTRAVRAGKLAQVPVEVWAVEKNPNAYVFLQMLNDTTWNRQVTVVKSDMRSWKGPLRDDGTHGHVDILVSELLGSFADNELSPECLDGVQHVLNPTHGISIPSSYTAHLTPIATPKIYADLLGKSSFDKDAFEVPYVVMLHSLDYLSVEPRSTQPVEEDHGATSPTLAHENLLGGRIPDVKTCWRFDHPLPDDILAQGRLRRGGGTSGGSGGQTGGDGANDHNTRFCSLTFKCAERGVCHGLAGYFETVLYASSASPVGADDIAAIELSTSPLTMDAKSKDMISWFPIFFPLKTPLRYPENSELCVSMWRCTDDRKVWYEWVVDAYMVLGNGVRAKVGMSDLHSSKKNGCLM
jgi:type II protein arginine methyltransferase